jgi:hypothetical protein
MLFIQMTQIACIVRCYKRKVGLFYVRLSEKQGFLIKGAAHRNICRSVVVVNKKYFTQRRSDKKHTFFECLFKQTLNRQIPFAGIVVEAENTRSCRYIGQMLRNSGQSSTRRNTAKNPFF